MLGSAGFHKEALGVFEALPQGSILNSSRAIALMECEDYADALPLLQADLEKLSHLETTPMVQYLRATCIGNLSVCLMCLNRNEESLDKMEQCRDCKLDLLGHSHPDYLISVNNVANILARLGRVPEALKLYQENKAGMTSTFGQGHPEYLNFVDNLAECLQQLGQYDDEAY